MTRPGAAAFLAKPVDFNALKKPGAAADAGEAGRMSWIYRWILGSHAHWLGNRRMAVFALLVAGVMPCAVLGAEEFGQLAKGEAGVKVTAPPDLVRNRKARPDNWEAEIIKTKLLDPAWPTDQPYSATVDTYGRSAFRVMVPEYYVQSCLACH